MRTLKYVAAGFAVGLGVAVALVVTNAVYTALPEAVRPFIGYGIGGAVAGLALAFAFKPEELPGGPV